MRALTGLSSAAMLMGCSDPGANVASVDVNAAAARAEGDIANYAAARKRGVHTVVAPAAGVVERPR